GGEGDEHTVVLACLDGVGNDLALGLHLPVGSAHKTLDRVDGVFRVDGRLTAGEVAHEALPGLGEGDHRGRGPCAFGIRDDHRLTTLHDRDHGVGGAEGDSNGLWHEFLRRCYVCAYFRYAASFPPGPDRETSGKVWERTTSRMVQNGTLTPCLEA